MERLTYLCKTFIKDIASVADAGGTFFASGNKPNVQWKTLDDVPEGQRTETVSELGWKIVVHSEEAQGKAQHFHQSK